MEPIRVLLWVGLVVAANGCRSRQALTAPREDEVCIAAGTFQMGHAPLPFIEQADTAYNPAPTNNWVPRHEVELSEFCIDKHEVTWARYRACVEAGICTRRGLSTSPWSREALTEPAFANKPARSIFYDEADVFCLWDGKRLPTEAEWERAARGVDGRDFPWGNTEGSAALLAPGFADRDVGSSSEDISPEGVSDMFASVREWVADYYSPNAYGTGELRVNPTGPTEAVFLAGTLTTWGNVHGSANGGHVVRGDRWSLAGGRAWPTKHGAAIWFRSWFQADTSNMGFRCARSGDGQRDSLSSIHKVVDFRLNVGDGGVQ